MHLSAFDPKRTVEGLLMFNVYAAFICALIATDLEIHMSVFEAHFF
jgi:hypothetical protein